MSTTFEKIALRGMVCHVYKQMGKAINDYHMLSDNDKVLVCVSGSPESLSLLKLFQMRQARIPIDFNIMVCFINANFIKVDKALLLGVLQDLKCVTIVKDLALHEKKINCFWCSWNRRKILFETARAHGCNKIAFGHDLDDIIETTLMNLFFHGEISTMRPKVDLFKGTLSVIRPFCYIEKKEIESVSRKFNFPDTHYECVHGKDSQRQAMKELIAKLSHKFPSVKQNIFRALGRVRKDYLIESITRAGHLRIKNESKVL